jgi:hypothetical protein
MHPGQTARSVGGRTVSDDLSVAYFADLLYEVDQAAQRYADVVVERDRLRLIVERAHDRVEVDEGVLRTLAVDGLVALVGVLRQDCRDAMVERDRLRAVVDVLVEFLTLRGEARFPPTEIDHGAMMDAWRRMLGLLDEVDT